MLKRVLNWLRAWDQTRTWIALTAAGSIAGGIVAVACDDQWTMELTQVFILAVTAIALFLYARDTRRLAADTRRMAEETGRMAGHTAVQAKAALEETYRPLAQLTLLQGLMYEDNIICPFRLQVLRRIPFLAKIDVRLTVAGKPVALNNPLYEGEEEWCIYASFRNLPCRVGDAIGGALPAGYTLERFVVGDATLPQELRNRANRIAVTPLMIYRSAEGDVKVTSAARSYLDVVRDANDQIVRDRYGRAQYTWMPDVERSRYPVMKWRKALLSDYKLEDITAS